MAPKIVKSTAENAGAPVISSPRHAYVTFLASDGDYVKGVVGLAKGSRKVGAAYPLVMVVLTDVPVEHHRLRVEQGCLLCEIEAASPLADAQNRYIWNYFVLNYCKLRLWEGFLNMFFREKMNALPPMYNLLVAMLWGHLEAVDVEKAKVVHYCVAGSKPWRFTGKEDNMEREDMKMLVNKWWDIYNDASLDFNVAQPQTKNLASRAAAELVVHYRSASSAA